MSYGYGYNSGMGIDEAVALILGVFTVTIVIVSIVTLAIYLFQAIGLYAMSKRRGYKNAWLAFIPFVNAYVLGGVADNINACMQKRSHHRITLLVTQIINGLIGIFSGSFFVGFLETAIYSSYNDSYMGMETLFVRYIFLMLLVSVASVVYSVFYYISCYKIFVDYSNNNSVLFIVLSILLGIAPFIIFALRNKTAISLSYANGGGYPQAPQPMYQQAPMQGYPQAGSQWYPQAPQQQPPYQAPVGQAPAPVVAPVAPVAPPVAPPVVQTQPEPTSQENDNQLNN